MYAYFPSCNFTQASPDTARALRQYLADVHAVQTIGCCRPGHKKLSEEDTALTICQSCSAIIRENTRAKEESIFPFLEKDEHFPWPDYHGEEITLQDCWRAKGKHPLHEAVRAILKKMNMNVVELDENRDRSLFCGVFRYNPMREANLQIAPHYFAEEMEGQLELHTPEEQQHLMDENRKRYHTARVAAYCNSCLRGLQQGGVRAVHVMDLMFPKIHA